MNCFDVTFVGLKAPREVLYERIRRKTEVMFEQGLLQK
jgi:tRNA A37 N6-isopentenylltransferase MiaA